MVTLWQQKLKADPIPWLLNSNPWTKYKTLTELVAKPATQEIRKAKEELISDPMVKALTSNADQWLTQIPTRNNDSKISYFKLRMLSDFGLNHNDPGINGIIEKAVAHKEQDMFAVRGSPPKRLKKGEKPPKIDPHADLWHIEPCSSPMVTYCLLSLGYKTPEVLEAVESLKQLWSTPHGWFCHLFFVDSQFKKTNAGCPMAGLMALDVFSQVPELKESIHAKNAFEPLKFHREYGKSIYYFGRSKKFWTLKYPYVWYNALYLADVLSRFNSLKGDMLVQELIDWIMRSQDQNGRFKPTSIFREYSNWDFSNKKEPSPWITFLCCRIMKNYYSKN